MAAERREESRDLLPQVESIAAPCLPLPLPSCSGGGHHDRVCQERLAGLLPAVSLGRVWLFCKLGSSCCGGSFWRHDA